jgi:hypothetical protein
VKEWKITTVINKHKVDHRFKMIRKVAMRQQGNNRIQRAIRAYEKEMGQENVQVEE